MSKSSYRRRKGFIINQGAASSKVLTYTELLTLYKLLDHACYLAEYEEDTLYENGDWFYFLSSQAEKYLGITERSWSRAVQGLKKKGLLSIKFAQPKGQLVPKNYYKINLVNVELLENQEVPYNKGMQGCGNGTFKPAELAPFNLSNRHGKPTILKPTKSKTISPPKSPKNKTILPITSVPSVNVLQRFVSHYETRLREAKQQPGLTDRGVLGKIYTQLYNKHGFPKPKKLTGVANTQEDLLIYTKLIDTYFDTNSAPYNAKFFYTQVEGGELVELVDMPETEQYEPVIYYITTHADGTKTYSRIIEAYKHLGELPISDEIEFKLKVKHSAEEMGREPKIENRRV